MTAVVPMTVKMLSNADQVSEHFNETSSCPESRPVQIGVALAVTANASTSAARVKSKHRDDGRVHTPQQLYAQSRGPNIGIGWRWCSIG